MNDPTENAEFEAYIGRRSRVSDRYRDLTAESPPQELDDAVLSLARAAQSLKRPQPEEREVYIGWMAPVAFAATVMLVFTVVLQIVIRPQIVPPGEGDAARYAPPASASAESAASGRITTRSDQAYSEKLRERPRIEHRDTKSGGTAAYTATELKVAKVETARPASVESNLSAPVLLPQSAIEDRPAREPAIAADSPVPAAPAAGLPNSAPSKSEYARRDATDEAHRDPRVWLAEIELLRRNGHAAAADQQLKLFLEKYPAYFDAHSPPPESR